MQEGTAVMKWERSSSNELRLYSHPRIGTFMADPAQRTMILMTKARDLSSNWRKMKS